MTVVLDGGMTISTRSRRVLRWTALVVSVAYLAWLVAGHWHAIQRALLRFHRAPLGWVLAAVAAEVVAQGCATFVMRRLLHRAGADAGRLTTSRLVLAQNAITLALPAGQAIASAFSFRQIRGRGPSTSAAAWVVAAFNVTTMLAVLGFGAFTATGWSWLTLLAGLALAGAATVLVLVGRDSRRLARPMATCTRMWDRLRRRPRDESRVAARVSARLDALGAVRMTLPDWALVGLFSIGAVAADCAVWFAAGHALLGTHMPSTASLFIAYATGQAAMQLPLPGGLGAVEALMTAALTGVHVRLFAALSAVLLYRLLTFWAVTALGTVMWLSLRHRRVRCPA